MKTGISGLIHLLLGRRAQEACRNLSFKDMSHMLLCMHIWWSLTSTAARLILSDRGLPPRVSAFPSFTEAPTGNQEAIAGRVFTDANLIICTRGLWVRMEASSVLESGIIYRSLTTSQKIDSSPFHMRTDVSQGGVSAWIHWWIVHRAESLGAGRSAGPAT